MKTLIKTKSLKEGGEPVVFYELDENKKPLADSKKIGLLSLVYQGSGVKREIKMYYMGRLEIAKLSQFNREEFSDFRNSIDKLIESDVIPDKAIILNRSEPIIVGSFDEEDFLEYVSIAYFEARDKSNRSFLFDYLGNIALANYSKFASSLSFSKESRDETRKLFDIFLKEYQKLRKTM